MVEAHTNVKMPRKVVSARQRYPLATMAVGAFYFLPHKLIKDVSPHVSTRGKALRRRFACRSCFMMEQIDGWIEVPADHEHAIEGVGVWRIA